MKRENKEHIVLTASNNDNDALCGYATRDDEWVMAAQALDNCPTYKGERGRMILSLHLAHPNMCKNCAKIYMARKKKESVK